MMPRSSFSDSEPIGTSKREEVRAKDKLMSSGLQRNDGSALFSKQLSTAELHIALCVYD